MPCDETPAAYDEKKNTSREHHHSVDLISAEKDHELSENSSFPGTFLNIFFY
jgi:hypothetical protein